MRKDQVLNRRLFLKGAGSVVVGLPLLEEMFPAKVWAQDSALPKRCLTMSFGLGIEKSLQDERWDGPLAPLQSVASKTAFFSNLRNQHLKGGGTVHFEVGATQFTGIKQKGTTSANGPSLEQIFRLHYHPNGVPSLTGLPSKSAGLWSRTGSVCQYIRHWNLNGGRGERPERRPSKVFDAIFGSLQKPGSGGGGGMTDPEVELEKRIRQSILDTVVEQYNSLKSSNSYLGNDSKLRIEEHLDTVRAVERELINGDLAATEIEQNEPGDFPVASDYQDPPLTFYDNASGRPPGPNPRWQDAQKTFRLSGKLFALGMEIDALRFGSMIWVGAGGHLRFTGEYNAELIGRSYNFSNTKNKSPHDAIFHSYNKDAVRVHQYFALSQLGYVLEEMDKVTEPNGKTLLDNSLVVLATEYSKNHNGGAGIFHAVCGGNGLFKAGHYDGAWGFNDVYKTVLDAYQIDHKINGTTIGEILA